ncbi:MAG: sugar phosphate isomerase/epimerase family protein [Anaerolineales bacterium]|nr:sugar phosphate isomerase/epimerase [Anaerolineales bacterium]MCS7247962.1 sugar phosphate isomerase/epimerase [Anaerolineales bacterium]MDW8161773.1 sugar phosphate isomerase/epimerase family protein [Anaerolineales bacterium]MDW8448068.1 sugar phosphate isomerase/epimerase family protein [Anaerolineales bacterium]
MIRLALAIQTPEVPRILPVALLQGSFAEKIQKAAALGYDGVEIVSTNPAELDRDAVSSQLRALGLGVSAVASGGMAFAAGLTLLHPDPQVASLAYQRLLALIDFACFLEAEVVTIGTFRGRAVGDKGASLRKLAEILSAACEYAAPRGVRLALEPLNRFEGDLLNTVAETLEFVNQVGHRSLGLLIDSFHVNIEESSWTQPYRMALEAGRLFYAHLGDNNRRPPGEGLIDFKAILTTLCEGGYQGWLSAELLPLPDPDQAARLTIEYIRPLLRAVSCD